MSLAVPFFPKQFVFSSVQVSKPLPSNVEERCKVALSHIVKASSGSVLFDLLCSYLGKTSIMKYQSFKDNRA